jgi:putative phage-type endonuclease
MEHLLEPFATSFEPTQVVTPVLKDTSLVARTFLNMNSTIEVVHDTEEWHAARRWGIGGSDAPVLYGESTHRNEQGREITKTREQLLEEKIKDIRTFEGNRYSYWGSMLEPVIIQHIANVQPDCAVFAPKEHIFTHTMQHYIRTSLDAVTYTGDDYILDEIKCTAYSQNAKVKEGPQRKHWIQMQHNLMVTGRKHGRIWYFVGGNKLYVHPVLADYEWQDEHSDICLRFHVDFLGGYDQFQLQTQSEGF